MRASRYHRMAVWMAVAVVAVLALSTLAGITSASRLGSNLSGPSAASTHVVQSSAATHSAVKARSSAVVSPHPGELDIYEAAGGGTTVDPSAAYYTVNAEPIWNVYETLIAYNGSLAGPAYTNYVPQGATCVPGSPECLAQTGSTLVFNNLTTGLPQYYTFEIDAGAKFYDAATSTSWSVYPSDVMFSLARTMAFSLVPGFGVYNGWINTQDLLPAGNRNWDGGLHGTYNTTPGNILNALLINDSAYCPHSSVPTNGCVTFNTGASGTAWPFFLELVADPMGASIQSCGAMTHFGGGVPGWSGSAIASGDGPCLLPDGGTTTNNSAWSTYIADLNTPQNATSWDSFEKLGLNYPSPQSGVQWNMIGSGPYYNINPVNPSVGYLLRANPSYAAPVGCAGQVGCLPLPGSYEPNVNVYWEVGDTIPLQQMAAGTADSAGFATSDTAQVLQIVKDGKYSLQTGIAGLSIFFDPFEFDFSVSASNKQDTHGGLNLAGNFLSNVALRQFLVSAFPYQTDRATLQTVDGVQYGEYYGGIIPHGMGTYYPTNLTWPNQPAFPGQGDPVSNPTVAGNVSWWWNELITPGTQWYNATFAACSSSSPCMFPMVGVVENPPTGTSMRNWISSIETLTGNALQPYEYDIHQQVLAGNVGLPPGSGNMPIYQYGWAPDYPDPTDYIGPMYLPDATYTYPDAVAETLGLAAFNSGTCGHATTSFADFAYWANLGQVPNDCQGIAYTSMNYWAGQAAYLTDLSTRQTYYTMVEKIAAELAFYMYWNQGVGAIDYGNWINAGGINTNVMIGGGSDQLWSFWNYASNFYSVTFTESGWTSSGTNVWTVSLAGIGTANSTTDTIVFSGVPNGTFAYTVAFIQGYAASPASGVITVAGSSPSQSVTFTAVTATGVAVTFYEQGLVSGTNYSITVQNVGAFAGNTTVSTFVLPAGTYTVNASFVPGYQTPTIGSVTVGTSPLAMTVTYTGTLFSTFPVTFTSSNLPTGQTWGISIAGFTNLSTTSSNTFWEKNGTFAWQVPAIAGLQATPSSGVFTVTGAPQSVSLSWTTVGAHYLVTFVEGGLPAGTQWTVNYGPTGSTLTVSTTSAYVQLLVVNSTSSAGTPWTVNAVTGFVASPASGSVYVAGSSPASVAIQFAPPAPLYAAVFTATGATSGVHWTLYVNNVPQTASGTSTTVNLAAGTYTWAVVISTSGYYATPSGGTITVTSAGASQSFSVAQTTSGPGTSSNSSTYLSTLAYALIGIFALLTVVFLVTTIMARRRPPSTPPQSWSSGQDNTGGGSPPSS